MSMVLRRLRKKVIAAVLGFDSSAGTNGGNGGSVTTLTWNHTVVTAGSTVFVAVSFNAARTVSVTCGGVAMTSRGAQNNGSATYIRGFFLQNVAAGTKSIVATFTQSVNRAQAVSVAYSGVTTVNATATLATGTGTVPAVTGTTGAKIHVSMFAFGTSPASQNIGVLRIQQSSDGTSGQLGGKVAMTENTVATTATNSNNITQPGSTVWAACSIGIS